MDLPKEEYQHPNLEGIPPGGAEFQKPGSQMKESTEQIITQNQEAAKQKTVEQVYPVGQQQTKPDETSLSKTNNTGGDLKAPPVSNSQQLETLATAANKPDNVYTPPHDVVSKIEQSCSQGTKANSIESFPAANPKSAGAADYQAPGGKQLLPAENAQHIAYAPKQIQEQSTVKHAESPIKAASYESQGAQQSARVDYNSDTKSGATQNISASERSLSNRQAVDGTPSTAQVRSESSSTAAKESLGPERSAVEVQPMNTRPSLPSTERLYESDKSTVSKTGDVAGQSKVDVATANENRQADAPAPGPKTDSGATGKPEVHNAGRADVQPPERPEVQTAGRPERQVTNSAVADSGPKPSISSSSGDRDGDSGKAVADALGAKSNRSDFVQGVSSGVGGGAAVHSPEVTPDKGAVAQTDRISSELHAGKPIKESSSGSGDGGSSGKASLHDDLQGARTNRAGQATDLGSGGVGGGSGFRQPELNPGKPSELGGGSDKASTAQSDQSSKLEPQTVKPSAAAQGGSQLIPADVGQRKPDLAPAVSDGAWIGPIVKGGECKASTDMPQAPRRDPVEIGNQISRELDRLLSNKILQPTVLAVIEHLIDKKPLPGDVPKDLLDVVRSTDPDRLKTLSVVLRGALAQQELLAEPKKVPFSEIAKTSEVSLPIGKKGTDTNFESNLEKAVAKPQSQKDSDFTEAISALKEMRKLFRELQQELPPEQRLKVITNELPAEPTALIFVENESYAPVGTFYMTGSQVSMYVTEGDETLEEIALRFFGDKNLAPLLIKANPRLAVGAGNVVPSGSKIVLPTLADIANYMRTT